MPGPGLSKPARVWLAVAAAACFAVVTVTDLIDHRVVPAIFTGLGTACFVMVSVLHARSPATPRTDPTDQA